MKHLIDFHEIRYGGNAIKGDLDGIIVNPLSSITKIIEVQISEVVLAQQLLVLCMISALHSNSLELLHCWVVDCRLVVVMG
jgi:hypothetical protein